MTPEEEFAWDKKVRISTMADDTSLRTCSEDWLASITQHKYAYNFTWMGRPIIQLPQDMIAMQEIIWRVQPDLIIETGIAHGGSLVYYASLLELLGGDRLVVGVDVDIRAHNRAALETHPMIKRIRMIEGSSIDPQVVRQVADFAKDRTRVLVTLDSNHTHEHVRAELELYSPFVTRDSYMVVFDTVVEDMPKSLFPDRPWGPGNNPKTAVWDFLKSTDRFEIDRELESKLLLTVAPDGYLKCVKD